MIKYKVKERREQIGMTQAELIKRSGISRAALAYIEAGHDVDIKVSTLKKLADAMVCSPASLFE